jgi:hypothetical protein
MKKIWFSLSMAFIAAILAFGSVYAQTEALTLRLVRDFGYGGFNGDIQGLFSLKATGPADLVRVEFYIDNNLIGEITKPPFNLQFSTDSYSLGVHQISVIGYSSSGQKYLSNSITSKFVTPQSSMKFILPILGVVLLAVLIAALGPLLASRRKHGTLPMGVERNYGIMGGAICPKCNRPFEIPMIALNLGFSKGVVCPNCGKWIFAKRESIEKLRQAEKAELLLGQPVEKVVGESEAERLRKELEDSKYKD